MILLEFGNLIVSNTLTEYLNSDKSSSLFSTFADFDGVQFKLSTPADEKKSEKTAVFLSISWACFGDLKKFGAEEYLSKVYGPLVAPVEPGFDFTVKIDLTNLPTGAELTQLIEKVSLLKRHALAAPFEKAFDAQLAGQTTPLMQINYRQEEAIWVQAQKDRVTVIFSTTFKDEADIIFGKVFLQEFVDARRQPALQNSPQVLFYPEDPPVELKDVSGLVTDKEKKKSIGYVTFVLFPRHYEKGKRDANLSLIQTFRDYLHYHIKCSKAYMHSRMRARVAAFLKVLNRAKPDVIPEKKTASGKTFVRRV